MSLVYGFEIGYATKRRRGAAADLLSWLISSSRDLSGRIAALLDDERSRFANRASLDRAMRDEETGVRVEFGRIADLIGLSDTERTALLGANPDFSRVILALETVGAALELCRTPKAAVAWLRAEAADEPFNQRSPLQAMAEGGRFGVEIALLHLRARLRVARLEAARP